jgi:flagella basal body P-ring formation protein FlgA
MKPEIVHQNEPVMLIYETPGITLTARGKAVNSGASGDLVEVLNLQSNRSIQGTVIGPGQVKIASGETLSGTQTAGATAGGPADGTTE